MVVVTRVLDWFWLTSAERAIRTPVSGPSARVLALSAQAALAFEAAQRTARPTEPFAVEGAEALACELYREAIHAALVAHLERSAATPPAEVSDLSSALERVDAAVLAPIPGVEAELSGLRSELGTGSYLAFAALPKPDQQKLAARLEALCGLLLEPLAGLRRGLERIWARRVLHVFVLLLLLGAAAWGLKSFSRWRTQKADYAPRASFTISSSYGVGGCKSPKQTCEGGENYFFHTVQESDPWITFDLRKVRSVGGIEVENRLDCCPERASPLAVDVSTDAKRWTEVARRTGPFSTWRQSFPEVDARYVRLHVPVASGILHLSRVRILP